MVSLRSGSCFGADQSSDAGTNEVQSCQKRTRRRIEHSQMPKTEPPKEDKLRSQQSLMRTTSRFKAKLDFLESPSMHTRARAQIPAISLSTELPEMTQAQLKALQTQQSRGDVATAEPSALNGAKTRLQEGGTEAECVEQRDSEAAQPKGGPISEADKSCATLGREQAGQTLVDTDSASLKQDSVLDPAEAEQSVPLTVPCSQHSAQTDPDQELPQQGQQLEPQERDLQLTQNRHTPFECPLHVEAEAPVAVAHQPLRQAPPSGIDAQLEKQQNLPQASAGAEQAVPLDSVLLNESTSFIEPNTNVIDQRSGEAVQGNQTAAGKLQAPADALDSDEFEEESSSSDIEHTDEAGPGILADTSSSNDESGSESDEDIEDPLAGLAASMWGALQTQRQGSGAESRAADLKGSSNTQRVYEAATATRNFRQQLSNLGTSANGILGAGQKDSSSRMDPAGRDFTWRPQTGLPKPAIADELLKKPGMGEEDTNLLKQLLAAPQSKKAEAKARAQAQQSDWHELPATVITDEVKRDLRLLRLRGAMDPKRFYKKADKGKFASKFAIGTVIEGPAEWFSGRLTKKERKQSITGELLADPALQTSRKRRFYKLQEESARWSHKKHKGSGERLKKIAKRPKH